MNKASEIIEEIKKRESTALIRRKAKREAINRLYESVRSLFLEFSFHIQNAVKIAGEYSILDEIDRIIICGVGANAVAADLLKDYLTDVRYPITVIRGASLPEDVNNKTLVIIISNSGEEEEPLLCYRNALRKGCRLFGVTAGGRIAESFERNNIERILLPRKVAEAAALPYLFFPVLKLLENSRLISSQKEFIDETLRSIKKPEFRDMAKKLAENCKNKVPLIYSSSKLVSVARRWKLQLNRIAKVHAFTNEFTDFCYGELDVFSNINEGYQIIILRDSDEEKYLEKSFRVAKDMIKRQKQSLTEILIKGANPLTKLISAVYIGDLMAYYISEMEGIDADDDSLSLVRKYRKKYKETV